MDNVEITQRKTSRKGCLVKSLIATAVIMVGIPLITLIVVIPVAMVSAGDYKVLYSIVSCVCLLFMAITGIMGLKGAFREDYYLHDGTVDLCKSVFISMLNLSGISLLGCAMFNDHSPAWLAIPGALAFLGSFAWAVRCVKLANDDISGKTLFMAACGRMFLISLNALISIVMAATVVALRDVLKKKESSASVRVREALDFNLKAVRIWGKNLGDGEVVSMLALMGIMVYLGQKLWLLVEATSNDRKEIAFTAFTYGVTNVVCAVGSVYGIMFLIQHTGEKAAPVQTVSVQKVGLQSEQKSASEPEAIPESSVNEPSGKHDIEQTSPVTETPVIDFQEKTAERVPDSGAGAVTAKADQDETSYDKQESGVQGEVGVAFSFVPDIPNSEQSEKDALIEAEGEQGEFADFQNKIGEHVMALQKLDVKSTAAKWDVGQLLDLLASIHQGEDVNFTTPDTQGNTALHYACRLGNAELVETLLDWGADPDCRNAAGRTPADCAGKAGRERIRLLLQKAKEKQAAPSELTSEQSISISKSLVVMFDVPGEIRMRKLAAERIINSATGGAMTRDQWLEYLVVMNAKWQKHYYSLRRVSHAGFNIQAIIQYAVWPASNGEPSVGYVRLEFAVNDELKVYAVSCVDCGAEKPVAEEFYTLDLEK